MNNKLNISKIHKKAILLGAKKCCVSVEGVILYYYKRNFNTDGILRAIKSV